ncbi:hypothetical protein [Fodinicola feengrottensis]|uniref:Uncharacterized protein n=1 Tax=Fodinicola feengrottensis TaxID=435914 RepID=A0ABP4T909_9ACTN|nr:hypothetical protein [Fodinicola feengrottensis]
MSPIRVALWGMAVPGHNRRSEFLPSNGGYAILGQLIADVTGFSYVDVPSPARTDWCRAAGQRTALSTH